jgi:hypothetical protein
MPGRCGLSIGAGVLVGMCACVGDEPRLHYRSGDGSGAPGPSGGRGAVSNADLLTPAIVGLVGLVFGVVVTAWRTGASEYYADVRHLRDLQAASAPRSNRFSQSRAFCPT